MKLKPLPERILSFLHLGDSYTIGEGVAAGRSWPAQLKNMLEIKGLRVRNQRILAKTGWTSGDLLQAMGEADLGAEQDLITICIGVNNQYQGLDRQDFRRELMQILSQASRLISSDGQVILLSIPDWSISPYSVERDPESIRREIELFNEVCFRTADTMDIAFIEWTSLTRLFVDEQNAFANDGLHPSPEQYREWATFVLLHLIPGS